MVKKDKDYITDKHIKTIQSCKDVSTSINKKGILLFRE